MKRNGQTPHRHHAVDYAAAAIEQMDIYCIAHPESPSAMRRPKLFVRSDLWIALLGPSIEEGIVGIGPNIASALRAFDAQYNAFAKKVKGFEPNLFGRMRLDSVSIES